MGNQRQSNLKLGVFIIAGFLVFLFFIIMVSKKKNLFGSAFELKTHFSNLNGLSKGDNVLFSGLQAGSVKRIAIIDDTTIEVDLAIDENLRPFIPKNTTAAVITDGLVGDKIVNLIPGRGDSRHVEDGDALQPAFALSKDEVLKTLSKTNNNIELITEILKNRILKVDTSALINLLGNRKVADDVLSSLDNLNAATARAKELTVSLNALVNAAEHGDGPLAVLLTDTSMAGNLRSSVAALKATAVGSSNATNQLNDMIGSLRADMQDGGGTLHVLLKDTAVANNLKKTVVNVKNGTYAFSEDMEALQHNFFLRGYFKRQERQREKERAAQGKLSADSSRVVPAPQ
jgi:phospholipid/cholesterol/gamma-HCH transport system substrate-binding protein